MTEKKVALIVASQGYQPVEYHDTRKALEQGGIEVIVVSDRAGEAAATDGSTVQVDVTLVELATRDIDGIVFIGGAGALPCLDNDASYELARQMVQEHKLVAAICISSRILARAGALKGKQATGWNGDDELPTIFDVNGVTYTQDDVVSDGLFVTGSGPAAAADFGDALVRALTMSNV